MPCRNERENLSQALERLPVMGRFTELIFVEGGSSDGTAEEAQRLTREYQGPLRVSFLTQDGKGKGDAVRKGFAHARGDILTILDADLTVPPEDLPRFYRALTDNLGEFINGSRLVYPMEDQAMRFLNLLGNKFFGLAFSVFLRQRVGDTLCGTKMLRRTDYELIVQGRSYFGDFDPFGDFDLLFGAAKLGLKIRDMPIRYRERVYGQTNISRFSHGWQLLRMCAFAFRKFAAFD
jgi:glycosyltransferase involved in cell wall biosynthesis